VGLSGEIRPVTRIDSRIQEATKLGFEEIYVSKYNKGLEAFNKKIKVIPVEKVGDLFSRIFG
jgi:DNA repair protein RadA/Sms